MSRDPIFPFTIEASEKFGGVPFGYADTFISVKPKDLTWYASNVIVLSPTRLEFVVFDMADPVYGGIGSRITSLRANCDPAVTRKSVVTRCVELAEIIRDRELAYSEDVAIANYTHSLLSELTREQP